MTDRDTPPSLEDVTARLSAVHAEQAKKRERQESRRASGVAQGVGFRIAAELVAAILVGAGIGYGLDQWLETKPLFMVVMIFLGFAAALTNIFRIIKGLDQAVGLGRAMREAERAKAKTDETTKA
ncbi:MAG: AtpZ/AtpI family protein [Rhodospirillaceae bacterium]|nr:AtpZ/AtpI family protein [Rhodospirillaceae bacterium]